MQNPVNLVDPNGMFVSDKTDQIPTIFYDENGNRMETVPDQVQKMFNEEYGIKVGYNNETGMLYYDGDVKIKKDKLVSEDARQEWISELSKDCTSSGSLIFGDSFSIINNDYDLKAQPVILGFTSIGKQTSFIDLGDFDGQKIKSSYWSNLPEGSSNIRAYNLARVIEHEFLVHGLKGYIDPSLIEGLKIPGATVDVVNSYREQMGLATRSQYTQGVKGINFSDGSLFKIFLTFLKISNYTINKSNGLIKK